LSETGAMTPEECPNCGADVPPNATSCPECGSDESTGWSDSAYSANLGIPDPDEDFDYDEFVKNEFGPGTDRRTQPHWVWVLVALIIVAVFLSLIF
jgi:hypothetical protein